MKRIVITALLLFLHGPAVIVNAGQAENHVRALFLYNFANYVEWPESAFSSPSDKLKMCLYGLPDFMAVLKVYDGTIIGERELQIFASEKVNEISSGCHILFVSKQKKKLTPDYLRKIKSLYVLSIGDSDDKTSEGEIISIIRTSDKVQFDIDLTLASANRLTISSDLLSLARKIKRLK